MKWCNKCKKHKDPLEFYFNKSTKSKLTAYCKQCNKDNSRKYSKRNRDKSNARQRRWYALNKDKINSNPSRINYQREYQRKVVLPPDKKRIKNLRRRALQNNASGKITLEEWQSLCEKYGNRCINPDCPDPSKPVTLDHVIPLKLGGANTIENAQPLCKSCNSRKNIKTTDYRFPSPNSNPIHRKN